MNTSPLFALAHRIKKVVDLARPLRREKGTWWYLSNWDGPYDRLFDQFDHAMAELESLRNPDAVPPKHPAYSSPPSLLQEGLPEDIRGEVLTILRAHEKITQGREWASPGYCVNARDVFAGAPGPIRALVLDKGLLGEADAAAVRLESLLVEDVASPPVAESPCSIQVQQWSELGLCIHRDGFYAARPCPAPGEVVRPSKATKLPLTGKRWRKLLEGFAASADGRTASINGLLTTFGYAKASSVPAGHVRYADKLSEDRRRALRTLTNAVSDLARELRELVQVTRPDPVFRVTGSGTYSAALPVGYLLENDEGEHIFTVGRSA